MINYQLKISVLICAFTLSACAVGPDFSVPSSPDVYSYNEIKDPTKVQNVDGDVQEFQFGNDPIVHWWEYFNSKDINQAILDGLKNSFNLKSAQAALEASKDNLKAGTGIFYPQVSAGLSGMRQNYSTSTIGTATSGTAISLNTLSASVSYSLDLFGGTRRRIEGLSALVDEQDAVTKGVYLMLTSNIANTVIAISGYRDQLGLTRELINISKEQLAMAEKQYQAGIVNYSVLLGLKAKIDVLEENSIVLERKEHEAEHLLSTLKSKLPEVLPSGQWTLEQVQLPQKIPVSLPSSLLERRPDILAARSQLHVASANVGIATAALFPNISLSATLGQGSNTFENLLDPQNQIWGLGLNVLTPIFNGGSLRAAKSAAQASYESSLQNYQQVVVNAFTQVADSLKALDYDAQQSARLAEAVQENEILLKLSRTNYQAGLINYSQMLDVSSQYYQAKINYLQMKAQYLQDTTALFVALGNTWRKK